MKAPRTDLPPGLAENPCLGESLDEFLAKDGLLTGILEQEKLRKVSSKPR